MKDYIKAKKDIEKINKKNNNEKRKQVFYSIWFIGYLITTYFLVELMKRFLDQRLDSLFLGPIKIVLTVLISILMLIIFLVIVGSLPIVLKIKNRTYKEVGVIVNNYKASKNKDHEKFYNDLLNIKHKPKEFYGAVVYYSTLAYPLVFKGRYEEAMKILDLLEENSHTPEMKAYIENERKYFKNELRVDLIIVIEEILRLNDD